MKNYGNGADSGNARRRALRNIVFFLNSSSISLEFIRLTETVSQAGAQRHDNCVRLRGPGLQLYKFTKLKALEYKNYEDIYTKHKHREAHYNKLNGNCKSWSKSSTITLSDKVLL